MVDGAHGEIRLLLLLAARCELVEMDGMSLRLGDHSCYATNSIAFFFTLGLRGYFGNSCLIFQI